MDGMVPCSSMPVDMIMKKISLFLFIFFWVMLNITEFTLETRFMLTTLASGGKRNTS